MKKQLLVLIGLTIIALCHNQEAAATEVGMIYETYAFEQTPSKDDDEINTPEDSWEITITLVKNHAGVIKNIVIAIQDDNDLLITNRNTDSNQYYKVVDYFYTEKWITERDATLLWDPNPEDDTVIHAPWSKLTTDSSQQMSAH